MTQDYRTLKLARMPAIIISDLKHLITLTINSKTNTKNDHFKIHTYLFSENNSLCIMTMGKEITVKKISDIYNIVSSAKFTKMSDQIPLNPLFPIIVNEQSVTAAHLIIHDG